jgi:hypothetical protein
MRAFCWTPGVRETRARVRRARSQYTSAKASLVSNTAGQWTKDSARVTADALRALGRADDAAALRDRYKLNAHASALS